MRRRQRTTRGSPLLGAVIVALMLLVTLAGVVSAAATHRPHMGARSSAQGTVYWNPHRNYTDPFWNVYRWGGCRTRVYWSIESSVSTSYHSTIAAAVAKWDNSSYCGPDFWQTTDQSLSRLKFRMEADGKYCGADHSIEAWFAVACRNSASSSTVQHWTIAFNGLVSWGVGASGKFDVQSIAVNELGHVLYLDHNTQWSDGTVQANSCKWGTTSCLVTNDLLFSDFTQHNVSCSNCGNRRTVLTGDWATVRYIYGLAPCTSCPELAGGSQATAESSELSFGLVPPRLSREELDALNAAASGKDDGMVSVIHYVNE